MVLVSRLGGETGQLLWQCRTGESIVVKAACLLEKSPDLGSMLLCWDQGQLTEGRIACECLAKHGKKRAG